MTDKKNEAPRLRVGPLAAALAYGDDKIHRADRLEQAIADLQKNSSKHVAEQLQAINETLVSMQVMLVALAADTKSEELTRALAHLARRATAHQRSVAKETGLDEPKLSQLAARLAQERNFLEEPRPEESRVKEDGLERD